ncbi:hypothetical protein BM613_03990 [Sulfoacidibacillus thermotolerans]|uniref:Uncharacterized protein n=1 Tax=Sulfoacidibacillus thermotolerans TaxID=1765684 RepID=A0A2U3DAS4_SULT2|nr:hypothetical protein BM613_03990 [Sulfoacidibacillus thermotolerans]
MIGQRGVGKTYLSFRLAQSCGMKSVFVLREWEDGHCTEHVLDVQQTLQALDAGESHHFELQTIGIGMSETMAQRALLFDSVGLSEESAFSSEMRSGMVKTQKLLITSDSICHVIDATSLNEQGLSPIDKKINLLAHARKVPYVLVVAKVDLLTARRKRRLEGMLRHEKIFFTSAKWNRGLGALKHFIEKENRENYAYSFLSRGGSI